MTDWNLGQVTYGDWELGQTGTLGPSITADATATSGETVSGTYSDWDNAPTSGTFATVAMANFTASGGTWSATVPDMYAEGMAPGTQTIELANASEDASTTTDLQPPATHIHVVLDGYDALESDESSLAKDGGASDGWTLAVDDDQGDIDELSATGEVEDFNEGSEPPLSFQRNLYDPSAGAWLGWESVTIEDGEVAITLTDPTASADGETAYTGSVTTDRAGGTLYHVVTESSEKPAAEQVAAGQDHTGSAAPASGDQAVTATGVQQVSGGGLASGTQHWIHYYQADGDDESAVATSSSFTTAVPVPQGEITFGTPDPGITSVSIPYTYSEGDADGFGYRVLGGSAVDIETADPAVVTGLTSDTAYDEGDVQLRAYNAGGPGPWFDAPAFETDFAPPSFSGEIPNQESDQRDEISLDVSGYFDGAVTFSATGLPDGLSIGETSGVITGVLGMPAVDGSPFSVTITGANDAGTADSNTFSWVVNLAPPIQLLTIPSQHGREEQEESIDFSGFFSEADSYSASGLPTGLSIDSETGVVSGEYQSAGEGQTTISATNDAGTTESEAFLWQVDPADLMPDIPLTVQTRVDEDTGLNILETSGGKTVGQDRFAEPIFRIRAEYFCEDLETKDDLIGFLRSRVGMTVTWRYLQEDYVCYVQDWLTRPHRQSGRLWMVTVTMVGRRA